jgi:hypothetical protein
VQRPVILDEGHQPEARVVAHGIGQADARDVRAVDRDLLLRRQLRRGIVLDRVPNQGRHRVAPHEQQHEQEAAIDEADRARHQTLLDRGPERQPSEIDDQHPGNRRRRGARQDAADRAHVEIAQHDVVDAQVVKCEQPDAESDQSRQQHQRVVWPIRVAEAGGEGGPQCETHREHVVAHEDHALLRTSRVRQPS